MKHHYTKDWLGLPYYRKAPCPWCKKVFDANVDEFFESNYYLMMCCSVECLHKKERSMGIRDGYLSKEEGEASR